VKVFRPFKLEQMFFGVESVIPKEVIICVEINKYMGWRWVDGQTLIFWANPNFIFFTAFHLLDPLLYGSNNNHNHNHNNKP
jgi:hypothetical protein